jgi:hypothetical protein
MNSVNIKFTILFLLTLFPMASQSQNLCAPCDCTEYPQTTDTCLKCCQVQPGKVSAVTEGTVTLAPAPSPEQPKPEPKTFKITKRTKIAKPLEVGKDATIYYHIVDGENVATKIDLTDYVEGQLTPDSLPAPTDNRCTTIPEAQSKDATSVLFGSTGVVALAYPFTALQLDGQGVIVVQKTKHGILISGKLFDSQGKLAAQIVDNHFFVNIKGALSLSHPDAHTLVISEGATTMVKIEFINEHTITVIGDLYGPSGGHVVVTPNLFQVKGGAGLSSGCMIGGRPGGAGITVRRQEK